MTFPKKPGLLFVLFIIAALDLFVYWNNHFYYQAKKHEDQEKRIEYLERSNKFSPLNDLVFYELGKSHFDLGLTNLGDPAVSRSHFQKAVESLRRAIAINPAYSYAHFYLAQSIRYLDVLAPGSESGFLEEFRRAAQLCGEDSRIQSEAGKYFFSRWQKLSPEDRLFTRTLLRKIMAMKDREQILSLLEIWETNVGDYEVIESVLPQDSRIFRMYARFLGEKSLSLAERQKFLAAAEQLDYEDSKQEVRIGEAALFQFRIPEAQKHFRRALELLNGIRFYQRLTAQNLIEAEDHLELLRVAWLDLAKSRIQAGEGLKEVQGDLYMYLSLESRPREIGDLEASLRSGGLLPAKFGPGLEDLDRLALELLLLFKQNRYRDIVGLGRELDRSFVMVPEENKRPFVRILQLIGDSFQKIDFLYDARDFYLKAREYDSGNLETLLRLRENSRRLNDEQGITELDATLGKILSPREIKVQEATLRKERLFSHSLLLDGRPVVLDLPFDGGGDKSVPLIAVYFNDRVVWEDSPRAGGISLNLDTRVGDNLLQILPLNRPVTLARLAWRPGDGRQ